MSSVLHQIIEELGTWRAERTTVHLGGDVEEVLGPNDRRGQMSIVAVAGTYNAPTKQLILTALCKEVEMLPVNSPKLQKQEESEENNDQHEVEDETDKGPRRSKRLNETKDNSNKMVTKENDKDKKITKKESQSKEEEAKKVTMKTGETEPTESQPDMPKEIESPEIGPTKQVRCHMELRERKDKENKQQEQKTEQTKEKKIKSPEKLSEEKVKEPKECQEQKVQKDKMELRERHQIKIPKGTTVIEPIVAIKLLDLKKMNLKARKQRRMSLEVRKQKEFNRKQRRMSLDVWESKELNVKKQRKMSIEVRETKEFKKKQRRMSIDVKERKEFKNKETKILDKLSVVKETRELRDRKKRNNPYQLSIETEPQPNKIKKTKSSISCE